MKKNQLLNLIFSAMFIALGLVLPFLTGQIQSIGNMLLPMHIPVMLCGLICGWQYGMTAGFILPLMRSAIFSMPVMFPTAFSMAFELAAYGFIAGFLFDRAKWKCLRSLYRCLIVSMIGGRLVWGIAQAILLGAGEFTFKAFVAGAILNAIPGIVLQLILIPAIMLMLKKTHLVPIYKNHGGKNEKDRI